MTTSFRDVKEDVLRRITSGDWAPGALLPTETDLAESYGCARVTVNRAMRELAEDGIIERRRKAGTRVRIAPRRQARFDVPQMRQEIEAQGAVYRFALVSREIVSAPDWLRARLGLDGGGEVLHLTFMHYADGAPYQFEDRWISLATLPQARDVDFSASPPGEWLIATIPFTDAEIGLSATEADATLAAHLGCTPGAALFVLERTTWYREAAVTYVRLVFRRGHRMTSRA